MSASFHLKEDGWQHQHPAPDVAGPDGLETVLERRLRVADRLPEARRADFLRQRPIEFREVEPQDLFEPDPADDNNQVWFRMPAAARQNPQMQQIMLAYASDMYLLGSALRPHGLTWLQGKVMTSSLDHAMWFHGPVEIDAWHLYTMDSPFSGGGRGFNRGAVYTADGRLVASSAQEGLMRPITR